MQYSFGKDVKKVDISKNEEKGIISLKSWADPDEDEEFEWEDEDDEDDEYEVE